MRSVAREKFLARMDALSLATKSNDIQAATLVAHDSDPSRLLRNGLAVVGFAAFEDFFVSRSVELLSEIDPARLPFQRLPEKLRLAATWGAVQTLVTKARFDKDNNSKISLIQAHSAELASTASGQYQLSELAFAPTGSNLSFEDIENALKSLLVEGPWSEMGKLASRSGYGVAGLSQVLKSSTAHRHEAAHLAEANMALNDIVELPTRLRVIAMCTDSLMRQAIEELPAALNLPNPRISQAASRVRIRFIDHTHKGFREYPENVARAKKVSSTREEALKFAMPRAQANHELLVLRDQRTLPTAWYMP